MKHHLYLLAFAMLLLMACDKPSPVFVYTTVEGVDITVGAKGDYNYELRTTARSTTGAVRHIVISSFDAIYGNQILLDTIFADPLKDIELRTIYHTNIFSDTTSVRISSMAYATDGETATTSTNIIVLPMDKPIEPIDDITLYSALSGKPSHFSLTKLQPVLAVDSGEIYFRDVAPKDSLSEALSYSWTSPDIFFARAESFDYAKATAATIGATYIGCTRDHTIQELKPNDVLLFGTATNALGVIKLIYIVDDAGRLNDRYIFSLKSISK